MGPVTLAKVVVIGIRLANGVDVVGAGGVQVKVLDVEVVGDCDGGISPFRQVLNNVAAAEGTAGERCDDDLLY